MGGGRFSLSPRERGQGRQGRSAASLHFASPPLTHTQTDNKTTTSATSPSVPLYSSDLFFFPCSEAFFAPFLRCTAPCGGACSGFPSCPHTVIILLTGFLQTEIPLYCFLSIPFDFRHFRHLSLSTCRTSRLISEGLFFRIERLRARPNNKSEFEGIDTILSSFSHTRTQNPLQHRGSRLEH